MGMYCWWWLVDKFGGCTHILEIINELAIPQFFTAMVLTIAQIVVQLGLLFLEKETDILRGFWKWGGWILGGTTILGNFHCGGFRVISTYLPDEVPAVRDFLTINGGIWCWPVTVWQDIKSWHNTKGPKRVHFLGDSDQMILTWSGLHLENSLVSCFWSFGDMSQSSRCAARGIPFWWTILLVEYCASSRNLVTVVTLQCSSWVWAMTQTYPDPTGDDHPLLTQLDRWHKRIGMACMTTTNSPATWPCHICIYTYIYIYIQYIPPHYIPKSPWYGWGFPPGNPRSVFNPEIFNGPGKLDSVLRMEYRTKLLNPKWAEAGDCHGESSETWSTKCQDDHFKWKNDDKHW